MVNGHLLAFSACAHLHRNGPRLLQLIRDRRNSNTKLPRFLHDQCPSWCDASCVAVSRTLQPPTPTKSHLKIINYDEFERRRAHPTGRRHERCALLQRQASFASLAALRGQLVCDVREDLQRLVCLTTSPARPADVLHIHLVSPPSSRAPLGASADRTTTRQQANPATVALPTTWRRRTLLWK